MGKIRPVTAAEVREMREMFRTHTSTDVALAFDRDRGTVMRHCRDVRPSMRGEKKERNARLLKAYAEAEPFDYDDLAARFGFKNRNVLMHVVSALKKRLGLPQRPTTENERRAQQSKRSCRAARRNSDDRQAQVA